LEIPDLLESLREKYRRLGFAASFYVEQEIEVASPGTGRSHGSDECLQN